MKRAMWPRRLTWLGGIAALLGCVPAPASPDAEVDATGSEHVEDARDPSEGAAPLDDGPPAPDVRADAIAEGAPDAAPDAPPDTPPDASPDAQVDAAPDARDAAPDLPDAPDAARDVAVDLPDVPDAPDAARDVVADLPADRADAPIAMDATRDVPADDVAPFDAPADDAAPPDGLVTCGDAPVAADARRDDAGRLCGQNGQPCCAPALDCAAGLGCVPTHGVCAPFGEFRGPCFPGRRCGAGLRCDGPGTGYCVCSGPSDSCGTAAGWACRELISVSMSYVYICCRMPGAACCSDRDCCGSTSGTAACRSGVCTSTGFVCNSFGSSCATTPCCSPFYCERSVQRCEDGN